MESRMKEGGAGERKKIYNHVEDVCADRHKSSIHGVPLSSAPQGLFDRNEIAAVPTIPLLLFLLLIFVAKVSSKKKKKKEEFLSPYRTLSVGVWSSRTTALREHCIFVSLLLRLQWGTAGVLCPSACRNLPPSHLAPLSPFPPNPALGKP